MLPFFAKPTARAIKAGALLGTGLLAVAPLHLSAQATVQYPCAESVAYNPGAPILGLTPATLECSTLDGGIRTPIGMDDTNGNVTISNSKNGINSLGGQIGTGGLQVSTGSAGITLDAANTFDNVNGGGSIYMYSGSDKGVIISPGTLGLNVDGTTNLNKTLTVTSGGANVTGDSTFINDLNVVGRTKLDSGLTVSNGGMVVRGNSQLDNNLIVTGVTKLESLLTVSNGGMIVTGNSTLNNDLNVKGATTLDSTLNAKGATTLDSTLNVKGATALNNDFTQQTTGAGSTSSITSTAAGGVSMTNASPTGTATMQVNTGAVPVCPTHLSPEIHVTAITAA